MSVVSQRFSRTSNAGGAPTRENNVVSLGGTIGARGLPPGPDLRPYKSLTCSDAMRTGPNGRHRGLLRLTECSHHVGSSGALDPWDTPVFAWDNAMAESFFATLKTEFYCAGVADQEGGPDRSRKVDRGPLQ